jgi:CHAT domain-containing protein
VVKYGVLADRILIWIIRKGRVISFVADVSARMVQASLDAIDDNGSGKAAKACRAALASFHDHLIAPARAVLPARLVIVPDDFLASVPFAALFDKSTKRHLVEVHSFVISRAPSCSDARTLFGGGAVDDAKHVLAIGNPWPVDPSLPTLPFAEVEARQVARRYRGATLLVQSEATKQRVLSALASAQIVHYAGHGEANLDNPDLSALYLAATDSDRGRLDAQAIATADLRHVRLVVLSACRSNVGRFSAQGALSLANAFLRAGTQTVVATLWDADDHNAERLLTAFHAHLQRGLPVAEALRAAQIDMLRRGDGFRSALTWAAYQVVG